MKRTAVIPARWSSSRFPGKPLVEIDGVPMVVRTARRVSQAESIDRVVVATDDQRIVSVCKNESIEAVFTSAHHITGTDRVAEACQILKLNDVINVQSDEPLIEPSCIDMLADGLDRDPEVSVVNAACPLETVEEDNENVVKAVCDRRGRLMFLSRRCIPFAWNGAVERWRHLGMYAFREGALQRFVERQQGMLELAERIEMYRYLEYGDSIALVQMPPTPPSIDIPTDVDKVESFVRSRDGWAHFT